MQWIAALLPVLRGVAGSINAMLVLARRGSGRRRSVSVESTSLSSRIRCKWSWLPNGEGL